MKKLIFISLTALVFACAKEEITPVSDAVYSKKDPTPSELEAVHKSMMFAVIDGYDTLEIDEVMPALNEELKEVYTFDMDHDNGIRFMIYETATEGQYVFDTVHKPVEFAMCFDILMQNGSTLGVCDFGKGSNHHELSGSMEVTMIRNDSIWVEFDLMLDISYFDVGRDPISVVGHLEGMPLRD